MVMTKVSSFYTVKINGSVNGLQKVTYTVPLVKPFAGFAHDLINDTVLVWSINKSAYIIPSRDTEYKKHGSVYQATG